MNSIAPNDKDYDALPLEGLGNIELPARVRPESQQWITAAKAVYGFRATELNEKVMKDLADTAVKDIAVALQRGINAGSKVSIPIRRVKTSSGLEIKQAFMKGPDGESIELTEIISGGY